MCLQPLVFVESVGGRKVLAPAADTDEGSQTNQSETVSAFELATCRSIEIGEELTIDYGLISDDIELRMACACGSAGCRGSITGADWRRADLRARYEGHWLLGLQRRIDRHRQPS